MTKKNILPLLLLFLFLPLFLYNLGTFSLIDFDEAWYAEIARQILVTKNPLVLTFNNKPFEEHPPLGFILMAISYLFFGTNEFAARLPEALGGFGAIIIIYLIGKNLFNRAVGIAAGLVLVSCVWFVFRARSANLDTMFLFFYLATFYSAIKAQYNPKWLLLTALSFSAALLTKTIIGVTIFPGIVVLWLLKKPHASIKQIAAALLLIAASFVPWLLANTADSGPDFVNHLLEVGLRTGKQVTPNWAELHKSITAQYLHFGMRKWYYPGIISLVALIPFVWREKKLLSIYAILLTLFAGFLTNEKTEIWHLIPLYPFLGLLIGFTFFQMVNFISKIIHKAIRFPHRSTVVALGVTGFFLVASLYQINLFKHEIKLFDREIGGLPFVSKAAQNRPEPLFLDNDYFLPGTVFYAQKSVEMIRSMYPMHPLPDMIEKHPKPFLLLTQQWKLDTDEIEPEKYELLSEHAGYVLIKVDE
ncbi:phospholipid carrier-dependent glycosyltransferase [Candidatus Microgenomates bacterium]|nr:MAG: phospholipid carrier-dependent glycosyltransferase [Candidatus Microgenomates bacterium]